MNRPDFSAFDEVWKDLSEDERKEAERLFIRYLELVIDIADEAIGLTSKGDERTMSMSYE